MLSVATKAFDLECLPSNNETCVVKSLHISDKSETIDKVNGVSDNFKIMEIYIYGQQVQHLPLNIGEKFSSLKTLKVQRSELNKIVRGDFKGIENLELISFHNNDLEQIDYNVFYDLQLLTDFDLSNNLLTSLHHKVFNKLISLKVLNLDSNDLREIDAGLFRNNKNLTILSIKNNVLKILPTLIFETLKSLEVVALSNNEIGDLQDQLFINNKQLKEISVADNEITGIGRQNFDIFRKLERFNFFYNPCTKNLKFDTQLSTIDNLITVIEKDCAVDNNTRVFWLEKEIHEIKRFKREDSNKLQCDEMELESNRNDINSTRDIILDKLKELMNSQNSQTVQAAVSGGQSKDSITKSDLENIQKNLEKKFDSKLEDEISKIPKQEALNLILKEIKDNENRVTSKIFDTQESLKLLAKENSAEEAKKTINLKTDKVLEELETIKTTLDSAGKCDWSEVVEASTEIKNDIVSLKTLLNDKVIKTIDTLSSDIDKLLKESLKEKCKFEENSWKIIELASDEKLSDVWTKFKSLKKSLDDKTFAWTEMDNLGIDTSELIAFKKKLVDNCGMVFT